MFNNLNRKIELIIIVNVILFTLSVVLLRLDVTDLFSSLGVSKFYVLNQLQIYRVFTYGFMHADILHIALNMIALISLSEIVLYFTNEKFMIRTYFISLVASGLGVIFFSDTYTIGASGAIYGLFGVLIYYAIKHYHQGNKQLFNSLITTIILNIVISFSPNVSMVGHLSGLVTGILLAIINDHYTKFRK